MRGKQLYLFGFHKNSDKASGRPKVILPLDTLILLGVIIILLFTLLFSLGVERGKKVVLRSKDKEENLSKPDIIKDSVTAVSAPQKAADKEKDTEKTYHVQVASFHKENSARKEAESLENDGYPVVITRKGDYVVIYVGGFKNKNEAKNNFENLQKRYKDCFLKIL